MSWNVALNQPVSCRAHVEPGVVRIAFRPSPLLLPGSIACGLLVWWMIGVPLSRPWLARLPLPGFARVALGYAALKPEWVHGSMLAIACGSLLLASRRRTDLVLEERGELRWHHSGLFRPDDGSISPDAFLSLTVHERDGMVRLLHGSAEAPLAVDLYPVKAPTARLQAEVAVARDRLIEELERRAT